jgi:hypothetical protein
LVVAVLWNDDHRRRTGVGRDGFTHHGGVRSMDEAVRRYIDAISAEQKPLFDRLQSLILELYPDAEIVISYQIPTYKTRGVAFARRGSQQQEVSRCCSRTGTPSSTEAAARSVVRLPEPSPARGRRYFLLAAPA